MTDLKQHNEQYPAMTAMFILFLSQRNYTKPHVAFKRPSALSDNTHPTRCSRTGMLQVLSAKAIHLTGSQRLAFSAVEPILWNMIPPEVRLTPTLLSFQKSLNMCGRFFSNKFGDPMVIKSPQHGYIICEILVCNLIYILC